MMALPPMPQLDSSLYLITLGTWVAAFTITAHVDSRSLIHTRRSQLGHASRHFLMAFLLGMGTAIDCLRRIGVIAARGPAADLLIFFV